MLGIFLALLFGAVALLALGFQLGGVQDDQWATLCYVLAASLFVAALTVLFWSWFPRLAAWIRGFRRYLWIVGGPVAFGLLLGGMEWLISTSFYNALGIGLAVFALAQLGFVEWASRVAQLRKQVEELTTERTALEEKSLLLRDSRDAQLRVRCLELSDDLDKLLDVWEYDDPQNQEAMHHYKQQFSGKVASVINDLKHFGLWKPKVHHPEKLEFPENREDVQSLSSYLRWFGHGFPI